MDDNQHLEIKIRERVHFSAILPPSLICVGIILIGIAANAVWPMEPIKGLVGVRLGLGLGLLIVGLMLLNASVRAFRKEGEKLGQKSSTQIIIESGPYGISRNPMYLAYLIMTFGVAIILGNGWIMLFEIPAIFLIHEGVVRREEHYLRAKFGDEFLRYKLNTNRWL